jgi:hypothetical protein
MAKSGPRAKKRKRRTPAGMKKKGGLMIGMRSGFKNVAHSVAGVGDEEPAKKKRSSLAGAAVTVVLVLVAAFIVYKRFL